LGGLKMRGYGKLQINQRKRTSTRILKAVESNEPIRYSELLKKSRVTDTKTLKKHLNHLTDSKILGVIALTCIPGFRNGKYYYKEPAQNHIVDLIDEECSFKHVKNCKKYYFGIKPKIPLHLQFIHKNRIIESQNKIEKLKKSMKPKSKFPLPFDEYFFFHNVKDSLLGFKEIQKDLKKNDNTFQKIAVEELDKFAIKYDLEAYRSSQLFTDFEKLYIIMSLPTFSINHIAKKFKCSKAPIKKIKKEFFIDDDHVNEDKVTKLHDRIYGERKYLINKKLLLDSNKSQLSKSLYQNIIFLHSKLPETEYLSSGQYLNWILSQK
jgi:hypothetical protein